jgi:2-polyprenyl-3-methyl-5-hydroxy-6-metoxy-1,4-benzoquinol methylase
VWNHAIAEAECIFCNQKSSQIVIEEGGYQCRKCPRCDLIYVSNRPSLEEIEKLYKNNDRANRSAHASILGFVSRRLHARHHLRIIKKFIKNGSLLEIGPGEGSFLYEARKQGFEVNGIELNSIQANFIKNRLGISCEESPLNIFSFAGKKFDIIYHRDVISHFYDPIAEFLKMNERLEDGGFLIFETGNLGDVEKKYFKLFTSFQLPDHLFFFSDQNLKELLKRTGFKFVKVYRYSKLPLLWIMRRLKTKTDPFTVQGGKKYLPDQDLSFEKINKFTFQYLLRNAFNYFSYLMLYKIGYVMPKKGRPLSLFVIAQKGSNLSLIGLEKIPISQGNESEGKS